MKILSETNQNLAKIMIRAEVSMKKRREYIEAINFCLFKPFKYPKLLYSKVNSFVNNGLKGEQLEKEIDKYFNEIYLQRTEAESNSIYSLKERFPEL